MEAEILAALKGRFPLRLVKVRGRLGLSREEERALRNAWLLKGVDFEEVGAELHYSEGGLEKISQKIAGAAQKKGPPSSGVEPGAAFGALAVERGAAAPKNAPAEAGTTCGGRMIRGLLVEKTGGPARVTVYRADLPNRQVLECLLLGTQVRVVVRVRSCEHFVAGMVLWARPEAGQSAWVFLGDGRKEPVEGAHCPRWRGKF